MNIMIKDPIIKEVREIRKEIEKKMQQRLGFYREIH